MKLTPWFPGHIKPVRIGWYQVTSGNLHFNSKGFLGGSRRFWDGDTWRAGWLNEKVSIMGTHPEHKWRGVTK